MKNFKFKDLIFPTIVSFVLSFMLIIYEPIITYAANTDDYWFSFKTLILNNLLLFLILFVCNKNYKGMMPKWMIIN